MTKNLFLASCAKAAFALVAAVMMSAAFAACSSSNDEPTPPPSLKAGTVTVDGVEKPILKAEYKDWGSGIYILYLYLSADGKERVKLELNKDLHMTGKPVDLTKKEAEHDKFNWGIDYYDADGTTLIYTFGDPGNEAPVFTTGSFTAAGSPEGNIDIFIDGTVTGTDGNVYELRIIYNGPMTQKK